MIEVVECDVDTPNVFSPNGDGIFDYLYFDNLEYHENAVLNVYNRWGHKVYSNEEYQICTPLNSSVCWDGTNSFTGGKCAEGVYFYTLTWDQEGVPKEETIKNMQTTISQVFLALFIKERCPLCSAPIVGMNPIFLFWIFALVKAR